jgi:hypothetical protein
LVTGTLFVSSPAAAVIPGTGGLSPGPNPGWTVYAAWDSFHQDRSVGASVSKFEFNGSTLVSDGTWTFTGPDVDIRDTIVRRSSDGGATWNVCGGTGPRNDRPDIGTVTPVPHRGSLRLHVPDLRPAGDAVQTGYGGGPTDAFCMQVDEAGPAPAATATPTVTPTSPPTSTPTDTPTNTPTPLPTSTPSLPKFIKCPKNSSKKKGKCACKKGYTMKKGKCVKKK